MLVSANTVQLSNGFIPHSLLCRSSATLITKRRASSARLNLYGHCTRRGCVRITIVPVRRLRRHNLPRDHVVSTRPFRGYHTASADVSSRRFRACTLFLQSLTSPFWPCVSCSTACASGPVPPRSSCAYPTPALGPAAYQSAGRTRSSSARYQTSTLDEIMPYPHTWSWTCFRSLGLMQL